MATATPASTLPKSKFHRSVISAPDSGAVSRVPPSKAPPHGNMEEEPQPLSFSHPNHVIPPRTYTGVHTLIVVCCHAVFHPDVMHPSFPLQSPLNEANWHLAPFQKSNPKTGKPGEHETFLAHIMAGLDALTTGSCAGSSLLVFSGGVTKSSISPLSEARSYYHAALSHAMSQGHTEGGKVKSLHEKGRILLEEQATDSYQNLLFSILLFRQTTGTYPRDIRIITHAFKTRRFLELHGPAIQWPKDRIRVEGIDPTMSSTEYEETVRGEERFGYTPWKDDPLGTKELLSRKREQRGWQKADSERLIEGLEPGVQDLFHGVVPERLPWSDHRLTDEAVRTATTSKADTS